MSEKFKAGAAADRDEFRLDAALARDDEFRLDAALARDTVALATLELCDLRLMDDETYPWLVLVPRMSDAVEIADLDAATRHRLMDEIAAASAALRQATDCDKLNVAALGNQVSQLHVHVIARYRSDPAWPGPVWGHAERAPYQTETRDALGHRIVMALGQQATACRAR